MVLPPVETNPLLLMRFTAGATLDLIIAVRARLAQCGIVVVTEEESEDGFLLGLTTTQKELEAEAEHVQLVKPLASSAPESAGGDGDGTGGCWGEGGTVVHEATMEPFTVKSRNSFLGYPTSRLFASQGRNTEGDYDSLGVFTSSDRIMLIFSMLDTITVLGPTDNSNNLSRYLSEKGNWYPLSCLKSFIHLGDPEIMHLRASCLWLVLQESNLIDIISPLHIPHIRRRLLNETLNPMNPVPILSLRNYYGEEVTYYFAWMCHFTSWLIFPGLLGLATYIGRMLLGDTVDTCRLTPFYGLTMFPCAVLFLRLWDREECRLAYEWGTFSMTGYEKKHFNARPGFYGETRISPVTRTVEIYYSPMNRGLKYVASALVTLVLLSGAFLVMILSLNLQGYVHPRDDRERWASDHDHPFYYPFLAKLAEEGDIFDAASYWRCYIPVTLHVCVVMMMNMAYRQVAEKLTEWENHETMLSHENSLILKRFLFEAFDAYIVLFYLAFYEKDMRKLRGELVSLFNVDTFRRLFIECVLPMLLKRLQKKSMDQSDAVKKKTDKGNDASYAHLAQQARRDPYEEFDDYLEMMIQLGYVTLFASAYPLAAFVAILANFVEIRTDILKLSKVSLRPRSRRTDTIGIWKLLMSSIIWLSALTNCLIFGFSSKQLYQWLPDYFYLDEYNQNRLVPGKGWYIIFLVFGIERALVFAALLINLVVPKIPEDVRYKLERTQYLQMQATEKLRVNEVLQQQRNQTVQKEKEIQDTGPFFSPKVCM